MTDATHGSIAEADKNAWPLLRSERTWGPWQLGISLATAAAATWCYIIGEYTGYYLGFTKGFAALFAGSMIGMLIVVLAAVPICIRFGVDSIASSKPSFGSRGWIIPSIMQQLSIVGWNSLLLIFFAKSTTQLLIALGIIAEGENSVIVPATIFLACALVFVFLLKGSSGVERISKILVAHVLVGLWMLYILLSQRWTDIEAATPAYASGSPLWDYTTGVEIGLVSLLSWWPYIGAMVRMAPRGRTTAVPIMIGMGAPVPVLSLIGIAGILALQVSDPAEWLRSVGGPTYGIVALIFVAAANLGTAVAGVYASAIGLRHFPVFDRLSWPVLLLLTVAPVVLVGLFIPELFFANFGSFLAFIGMAFAPLCGIQIFDYYFLRNKRIDVRAMFLDSRGSTYRFWGGFNPAAIIAMAVGCGTYLYLLNPLTYASHSPYDYTTATLPTVLITGIVHVLATKLIVKPAGKGGY
jgi:NCS1 family nucleobase:cation symporter-1